MRRHLIDHLRELIDQQNQMIAHRNEGHIVIPERQRQRADRRSLKQIKLAKELLIAMGAMKKPKYANLPNIEKCNSLNTLRFDHKLGNMFFITKRQGKKTLALKFDHMAGVPSFTPSLHDADLYSTKEACTAAIEHVRTTPNSRIDIIQVKDVMHVVYGVHVEGYDIKTTIKWQLQTTSLWTNEYLSKAKADKRLEEVKAIVAANINERINSVRQVKLVDSL